MPVIERKELRPDHFFLIWELTETEDELLEGIRFSEKDRNEYERFTHPYRKKQWLATRQLLKIVLPGCDIYYDEHGKPLVSGNSFFSEQVCISISHSGSYIAMLFDTESCGIDIETIRPKIERIAPKFLSEKEMNVAMKEPSMERLHVYWCVKESLYKAYGKKNISLRSDIFVDSMETIQSGKVTASLTDGDQSFQRPVSYMRFRDCMLAWTESSNTP
jgi:4'-phosphopantetheinyl transferase